MTREIENLRQSYAFYQAAAEVLEDSLRLADDGEPTEWTEKMLHQAKLKRDEVADKLLRADPGYHEFVRQCAADHDAAINNLLS